MNAAGPSLAIWRFYYYSVLVAGEIVKCKGAAQRPLAVSFPMNPMPENQVIFIFFKYFLCIKLSHLLKFEK